MCTCPSLQADGETLPASLMLTVKTASGATAQGRIEAGHLADHPAAVRELQEAAAVGARLGPLLVLDRLEVILQPTSIAQSLLATRTTVERPEGFRSSGCGFGSQQVQFDTMH